MTIKNCLDLVDQLTGNQIDRAIKVMWLGNLDRVIYTDVLQKHVVTDEIEFSGYDGDTDGDTVLLAPAPYDEVYRWYLEMQIHGVNSEVVRSNNAAAKYNAAMLSYMDYVNRTYMPKGQKNLKLY